MAAPPILVLMPDRIMAESTYAHVLPYARPIQPVVEMDASSRSCNPAAVREALTSGAFSSVRPLE